MPEMQTGERHLMVLCQSCRSWNRIRTSRVRNRPKCGKCGTVIPLDRPLAITDESFDRTIAQSEVPVLVDFYADWCGPCRQMSPFIDALASEQLGRALIAKLDTDRNQRTMQQFGVRGIPTVIVFNQGREVARNTGGVGARELQALLARAL